MIVDVDAPEKKMYRFPAKYIVIGNLEISGKFCMCSRSLLLAVGCKYSYYAPIPEPQSALMQFYASFR